MEDPRRAQQIENFRRYLEDRASGVADMLAKGNSGWRVLREFRAQIPSKGDLVVQLELQHPQGDSERPLLQEFFLQLSNEHMIQATDTVKRCRLTSTQQLLTQYFNIVAIDMMLEYAAKGMYLAGLADLVGPPVANAFVSIINAMSVRALERLTESDTPGRKAGDNEGSIRKDFERVKASVALVRDPSLKEALGNYLDLKVFERAVSMLEFDPVEAAELVVGCASDQERSKMLWFTDPGVIEEIDVCLHEREFEEVFLLSQLLGTVRARVEFYEVLDRHINENLMRLVETDHVKDAITLTALAESEDLQTQLVVEITEAVFEHAKALRFEKGRSSEALEMVRKLPTEFQRTTLERLGFDPSNAVEGVAVPPCRARVQILNPEADIDLSTTPKERDSRQSHRSDAGGAVVVDFGAARARRTQPDQGPGPGLDR